MPDNHEPFGRMPARYGIQRTLTDSALERRILWALPVISLALKLLAPRQFLLAYYVLRDFQTDMTGKSRTMAAGPAGPPSTRRRAGSHSGQPTLDPQALQRLFAIFDDTSDTSNTTGFYRQETPGGSTLLHRIWRWIRRSR